MTEEAVHIVWVIGSWGADTTPEEDEALVEAAQAYLDEHKDGPWIVTVHMASRRRAPGVYDATGPVVNEDLEALLDAAWMHARARARARATMGETVDE